MPAHPDATTVHLQPVRSTDRADELTATQDMPNLERAAALSQPREQPPANVPGYAIARCIGEGAYGSVWLARELNTGKQVAIKFYTHRRGLDWSLLNREVDKLALLYTSRNIIGLLSVGWESDPPFYVMEYLDRGSLADHLAAGTLPAEEAVRMARSVLHALVHAHGMGVLHCDLKPANVLLDDKEAPEPRLCDFGQSRLSNEQYPALGTLFYMAPEQADLTAIPDARWDVYALGALLYHMLTGEPPFRSPENEARIRSAATLPERLEAYREVLRTSPRPNRHRRVKGVDRRLAEIVDRCLKIDPQKRYPNAQAVLDALEDRERRRARRPLIGVGILGPLLILVAMGIVFWQAMSETVRQAQNNIVQRAQESDLLSASLLARSLERELDVRFRELRHVADDPNLQAAILRAQGDGWSESVQEVVRQLLDTHKIAILESSQGTVGAPFDLPEADLKERDASWFFTDAAGTQRWRSPRSDATEGKRFQWRDYFHGGGRDLPRDGASDVEPIRSEYVSVAFISNATGYRIVALSVPVFTHDRSRVIGVLARTFQLTDLMKECLEYGELIRGNDEGISRGFALVDNRDQQILYHLPINRSGPAATPEDVLQTRRFPKEIADELNYNHSELTADDYVDPVLDPPEGQAAVRWLAAFKSVEGRGWTAVVQEHRDEALRPVSGVQQSLKRHGLFALAAGVLLIPVTLYCVMWTLNDRRGGSRGRSGGRQGRTGGSSLGTGSGVRGTPAGSGSA